MANCCASLSPEFVVGGVVSLDFVASGPSEGGIGARAVGGAAVEEVAGIEGIDTASGSGMGGTLGVYSGVVRPPLFQKPMR